MNGRLTRCYRRHGGEYVVNDVSQASSPSKGISLDPLIWWRELSVVSPRMLLCTSRFIQATASSVHQNYKTEIYRKADEINGALKAYHSLTTQGAPRPLHLLSAFSSAFITSSNFRFIRLRLSCISSSCSLPTPFCSMSMYLCSRSRIAFSTWTEKGPESERAA